MVNKSQPEGAFGKAFHDARRNIPQNVLADKLGVSEQAVSKWFSGGGVKLENFAAAIALMKADANVLLRAALEDAHAEGKHIKVIWPESNPFKPEIRSDAVAAEQPLGAYGGAPEIRELCAIVRQLDEGSLRILVDTARTFSRAKPQVAVKKSG